VTTLDETIAVKTHVLSDAVLLETACCGSSSEDRSSHVALPYAGENT
jgi:hypothetical protein